MLELDPSEKLVTVFRKHIFHVLTQLSTILLVALLPLVAYPFVKSFFALEFSQKSVYFFFFIYCVFLTILWHVAFVMWTDYYLDMWVLTDKRLINVEQKGLFAREVSSLRLDKIQDIKSEISGLINTFVGMGTISVQTAGNEAEFVIRNAKRPEHAKELILSEHNRQMEEAKTVRIENPTVA